MLYALTKAAHLISLFVWVGGMTAVAIALRHPAILHMAPLKRYDRAVTTPAMLLALLFGILLGVQGGWFTSGWLGAKIVVVLVLAGLHGVLVGKLRHAVNAKAKPAAADSSPILAIGGVCLSVIVLLASLKPF